MLITFLACHKETTEPEPVDPYHELILVGIANRYQEGFEIWYVVELKDTVTNPICVEIIREDRRGNRYPVPPWKCYYIDEKYHYYLIYRLESADYYPFRETKYFARQVGAEEVKYKTLKIIVDTHRNEAIFYNNLCAIPLDGRKISGKTAK